MPTYFFDLIKGNELVEDDQGEDFADIEAAKLEGLASARELLADAAKKGILATSPVYLIRNAAGDILATVPLQGRPQTRLKRFHWKSLWTARPRSFLRPGGLPKGRKYDPRCAETSLFPSPVNKPRLELE